MTASSSSALKSKLATAALEPALIEIERAVGSGRVLTDPDVLSSYARDESEAEPSQPEAVVRVQSTSDVAAVMRAASKHRVPVTPRAGGPGAPAAQSRSPAASCSRSNR